jgi:hypothetical protein
MADLVTRLLNLVEQHGPGEAERIIRQEFGGTEPYIAKRIPQAVRIERLAVSLQSGVPLPDAFAQAGVPRRTGFRLLRQPNRPRRP